MKGLARIALGTGWIAAADPSTEEEITRLLPAPVRDTEAVTRLYEQLACLLNGPAPTLYTPEAVVGVLSVVLGAMRHGSTDGEAARLGAASDMLAQAAEVLGGRLSSP